MVANGGVILRKRCLFRSGCEIDGFVWLIDLQLGLLFEWIDGWRMCAIG